MIVIYYIEVSIQFVYHKYVSYIFFMDLKTEFVCTEFYGCWIEDYVDVTSGHRPHVTPDIVTTGS